MDLSRLLKIKDKEQFEDALGDELGADFEGLPLEEGCVEGGFPEPTSVYVYDVDKTREDKDNMYATFSVSFTEAFNTSCADCVVEKPRLLDCSIVIDKFMKEVEITVKEVDICESEF